MKSSLVIFDQKPITNVTTAGHVEVLVRLSFGGGAFRICMMYDSDTLNQKKTEKYEVNKLDSGNAMINDMMRSLLWG